MLTQDQHDFQKAVRDFCADQCGTREQRQLLTSQGEERHNQVFYQKLADLGWLGVGIPEEYGGSGGGLVDRMILFEELHRGMAPVAGIGPSHIVAGIYDRNGRPEQKHSALGAIAGGTVMSISISEPEAGSDVANVCCAARPTDTGFVLNGQKTWCSAAHHAQRILLLARTSRAERRQHGLTLFEIPTDAEGLTIHEIGTMGGREVNDLYLSDVEVSRSQIVGSEGDAWAHIMSGLDKERLLCAALALGLARRALDDLIAYITERRQFGRTIGSFQAIRHRTADLLTEIECSELLTYNAARLLDDGGEAPIVQARRSAMAKLKATETAKNVALEGMQMMGGYGYSTEFDMEAHVRTSLLLPIYAGTNEIQREIIAKSAGLREEAVSR